MIPEIIFLAVSAVMFFIGYRLGYARGRVHECRYHTITLGVPHPSTKKQK